jgi:hypothetical protein
MCETKFLTTKWCDVQPRGSTFSPEPENTIRSGYRVLRAVMGRPIPRSVDRNHAGRNAKPEGFSVKRLSPVKRGSLWWPSQYAEAKAIPERKAIFVAGPEGTTGVREHGMYEKLLRERMRSLGSRVRMFKLAGRSLTTKSAIIFSREVRCLHSSWEVG